MVPIVEKIFEDCGVSGFWFPARSGAAVAGAAVKA
jgi:hypothetical protein